MTDIAHLFDAAGRWIAWYRPGMPYVWNVRNQWVGWFPWPGGELAADVLDPSGEYLGTVFGDRLFRKTFRAAHPIPQRVGEPQRPSGPPDVDRATPRALPPGYTEVPAARMRGDRHPDYSG